MATVESLTSEERWDCRLLHIDMRNKRRWHFHHVFTTYFFLLFWGVTPLNMTRREFLVLRSDWLRASFEFFFKFDEWWSGIGLDWIALGSVSEQAPTLLQLLHSKSWHHQLTVNNCISSVVLVSGEGFFQSYICYTAHRYTEMSSVRGEKLCRCRM